MSSAIAAGLATLLHVVAGRTLGAEGYAHFLVVWGLFFTFTGVLPGLQQEVVRTVARARLEDLEGHRPVVGSLAIGLAGFVIILVTSPVWARQVLDRQSLGVVICLGLAVLCYAWANHVNGALAATHRWPLYAQAILLDGVLRFLFVGAVLLLRTGEIGWAIGLLSPALTWGFLATIPDVREATMASGDARTGVFVRRTANAILSAGCASIVVSGFPVLLQLFGSSVSGEAKTGVVLAVLMATRAPLLLFLNAYQGVWITQLVDSTNPMQLLVRWSLLGTLMTIPSAVVGYLAGPWVLESVFGPDYVASPRLFVALVVSGLVLAIITLTGWTALALERHTLFLSGWLVAVVATSAMLTLPMDVEGRVSAALIAGPLCGACVHVVVLRWSRAAMRHRGETRHGAAISTVEQAMHTPLTSRSRIDPPDVLPSDGTDWKSGDVPDS